VQRITHIENFSGGLVTNLDTGDARDNTARTFTNCRADQFGKLRGIRGTKAFETGPTGLNTLITFHEVVLNDTQVMFVYGTDSNSIDRFYYSSDGGSNWVEITEFVALDVNTVASTTSFTLVAGSAPFDSTPSSTDDTYNKWWLFYHDSSTPANDTFDYVLDYTGSSKTITSKYGCTSIAAADKIILMRFPLWNFADLQDLADATLSNFNDHRNWVQTGFKPHIVQRQDAISIYAGRKKNNLSSGVDNHTNLWFGYVKTGNIFDDTDLSYTDYHAERKMLDKPVLTSITTDVGSPSNSDDSLPEENFGIMLSFIYDGYQESGIYFDNENVISVNMSETISANEALDIDFSFDRLTTSTEMEFHAGSRRITGIRVYMGNITIVNAAPSFEVTPTGVMFFVKEIDIISTDWSGTGPYTLTVNILATDWNLGQFKESEAVTGYFDLTRANAEVGVKVGNREIVAGIVTGTEALAVRSFREKPDYLQATPINDALRNASDAITEGGIKQTRDEGIFSIQALAELNNNVVVFGKNHIAIYAIDIDGNFFPQRVLTELGIEGRDSYYSTGLNLYWNNQNSIYQLPADSNPIEIGYSIRDTWQGVSSTNRQNAVVAFDPEENLMCFSTRSDGIYIYDIQRRYWTKYVSSATTNWEWIGTGVDGEMLGTDGTNIIELFSSTSTESLSATYEKDFEFHTEVNFKQFHLNYKSTARFTVTIYDLSKGTNFPIIEPIIFFPNSNPETRQEKASFRAQRIRVKIEKAASTDQDWAINSYSLFGTPVRPE